MRNINKCSASIATIARMFYIWRISFVDPSYSNNPVVFWANIEVAINIIATSATTWKPLMFRTGILSSSSDQQQYVSGQSESPAA